VTTADEAVAYLDGLGRFASLGLGRMEALCAALGHPEEAFDAYHVAGTNGKGSVCAFLAAMLWQGRVPAGLYTSPPLQEASERLVVAARRIAGPDLARAADRVRAAATAMAEPPTAFEAWTGAAFDHLARAGIAVAVVEVGLGGRGDATAVLRRPLVSVLVTVARDHVAQLGPTLDRIAAEKAGIFRPGRPVVLGRLGPSARRVARGVASSLGCPVVELGRDIRATVRGLDGAGRAVVDLDLDLPGGRERLAGLELAFAGAHQADNAALAVAALRLGEARGGPRLEAGEIRRGLASAVWPGRLERQGDVLLDGAHNEAAARALARHLGAMGWGGGDLTWVLAGMRDRPPAALLGPLLPLADRVVVTPIASARGRPARVWRVALARRGRRAEEASDAAAALRLAMAGREGARVLVAGSLALVGEARTALGLAPAFPEDRPRTAGRP
jgi:dihydrofolate synthase/folylpolyglutamate synthase